MTVRTPWLALAPFLCALTGCPTTDGTLPADDSGDIDPDDTGGGPYTVCPDYEAVPLAVCLAWDGAAPDGFGEDEDAFTLALTGTVVETGVGAAGVDCGYADDLLDHAPLGDAGTLAEDDATWVRITDDAGVTWTVVWQLPGLAVPAVDAEVTLDFDWHRGFSETRGQARLVDADGALLGWVASESRLENLELPAGLTATYGDSVCMEASSSGCYDMEIHRVTLSDGATQATLAPGDAAELGGVNITLGYATTYAISSSCEDGPDNHVALGAAPL